MKSKHSKNLGRRASIISRRVVPIGVVAIATTIGIITINISKADTTTKPVSIHGSDPVAIGCTRITWKIGSSGPCVLIIQNLVNDTYPGAIAANGQYTTKTKLAVMRWQADKKSTFPDIEQNGIVGPETWKAVLWNK